MVGIPHEQLQRAMRGNVTTYELNQHDIMSMVEGRLMPRRPAILASLIAITFIGHGRLTKDQILPTFRVHRRVVQNALRWLKNNNPDYYGDIKIDEEHLGCLPEDDVPEELMSVIRHSDDTGMVEQENDTYVAGDTESTEEETVGEPKKKEEISEF